MKKLIAISVVFALVAGAVFAVDVGGAVIGTVTLLKGDSGEGSKVTAGGEFNRVRLEGSGETEDGKFGGWLRAESGKVLSDIFEGYAWWKPIDQFKLTIGGNSDGVFGKEGYTGWMFYQTAADTGVVKPGNTWGGGYSPWPAIFRSAFYGGFGGYGLMMTISPVEVVDINLVVPFISIGEDEAKEVFKQIHAQVDLKFGFGNIAITYRGQADNGRNEPTLYGYFNLGAIDNLSLDVGVGFELPKDGYTNPFAAGLAVKYDINDSFGFKVRGLFHIPLEDDQDPTIVFDVLPYFGVNDSLRIFLSGGLAIALHDDAVVGFHVNPYVEVGTEWGPKFVAGFQLWSDGKAPGADKAIINWGVPIAVMVSF